MVAICESTLPDNGHLLPPPNEDQNAIAKHIIDFLCNERDEKRLPKNLLPLQSGVGGIANAVV